MVSRQVRWLTVLFSIGLAGSGLASCSSSSSGDEGGTGGAASGTGGSTSTGGASTGGKATGGAATGGSTGGSGTGGSVATGGAATGGAGTGGTSSGGSSTGGTPAGGAATGGRTGGSGGATASGGSSTGGSSGTCEKGKTKGADVAILGESFYAIDPKYIQNRIQDNARKAGSLGANESYDNVAVSGQNMNYIATTEWTNATSGGKKPKWIIMDGGGIDCLGSSSGAACSTCSSTFKTLLTKMGTAGVTDVIYTRYPEPGAPPGSNKMLKACLDATMPGMQTACEASTSPRCHWLDLRPVWVDGDTTDGLHPTQSGGNHVGDLIWSEMMKLCFAQ